MAASDKATDDSLYPIAVLIDELKNEDIQVNTRNLIILRTFNFYVPRKTIFYFSVLYVCVPSVITIFLHAIVTCMRGWAVTLNSFFLS